jgi:hypothetical protein
MGDVVAQAGPKIVDHDQPLDVGPLQQTIGEMRTDKTGAAGKQYRLHVYCP